MLIDKARYKEVAMIITFLIPHIDW